MGSNLDALTTVFMEFYYWVTVVFMFLIHVGFCLYDTVCHTENSPAICGRALFGRTPTPGPKWGGLLLLSPLL